MPDKTSERPSEKQKLYLTEFDILRYLINNSSAERPVSINDIAAYYTACIDQAYANGIFDHHLLTPEMLSSVEKLIGGQLHSDAALINESVRTYIKRFIMRCCGMEILPGITLECVKKSRQFVSGDRNYYVRMPFTETQTVLLRDAISVYSYAEPEETAKIVDALNRLTPVYNREIYSPELADSDKYKGSCFKNLEEIRKAFVPVNESSVAASAQRCQQNKIPKKLRFIYCRYNAKKELEPMPSKDGTVERVVDPVKILWANGYYYLVTFRLSEKNEPKYINYRIDRIKDVKCLDEYAEPLSEHLPRSVRRVVDIRKQLNSTGGSARIDKALAESARRVDDNGFSSAGYRSKHPVMYTGDTVPVIRIKCSEALMNNAIDTFGFDFAIEQADEPGMLILTLRDTAPYGVKMWALEYGDSCEVLEPQSLRDSIKETIMRLNKSYM